MPHEVCPYPFSRLEVKSYQYVPCCPDWLDEKFNSYIQDEKSKSDPWNSEPAKLLRSKVIKGDYSLCRRDICHIPLRTIDQFKEWGSSVDECPIDGDSLEKMLFEGSMPHDGPTSISINSDNRCNLACPSCRSSKILHLNERFKNEMYYTLKMLKKYRDSIQVIKMCGDGEVFFSSWMKKIVKIAHAGNFKNIKAIHILTNGLLLTPKMYNSLKPGILNVREISVSIDAGNEFTYSLVRGGRWKTLLDNLFFVKELHDNKVIDRFYISFVARKANYKSIPGFVELAHKLGVTAGIINTYCEWGMSTLNYKEEAIHLSDHPDYENFKSMLSDYINDPKIAVNISL